MGYKENKVYFIYAKEVNRVKIGFTTNLTERFENLQASSPCNLEVLLAIPGDFNLEQTIHTRLKAARLRVSGLIIRRKSRH